MTAAAEKELNLEQKALTILGMRFPAVRAVFRGDLAQSAPKSWEDITGEHLDLMIRRGLSVDALENLRTSLGVPHATLEELLGTSRRTLQRARKEHRRLSPVESDRAYRLANVFALASAVFENEEAARAWLKTPQIGLGGKVPYDLIHTEVGTKEVIELLKRIEYGVLA